MEYVKPFEAALKSGTKLGALLILCEYGIRLLKFLQGINHPYFDTMVWIEVGAWFNLVLITSAYAIHGFIMHVLSTKPTTASK